MPTIREIKAAVAQRCEIPVAWMVSGRKCRQEAHPRQLAYYLSRDLTPHSLPVIGHFFGDRDHTTIAHGIRQVEKRRAADPEYDAMVSQLIDELGAV